MSGCMRLRPVIAIAIAVAAGSPAVGPASGPFGGVARAQGPAQPPIDLEALAQAAREAMQALSADIAPWMDQLGVLLDDPGAYEAPVLTPDGDIVIRRRRDAPPLITPSPDDDGRGLSL